MSPPDGAVAAIEAEANQERKKFAASLTEASGRLRPQHLVDVGTDFAKKKAGVFLSGVTETVKANGGAAAAIGLGAIVAFDVGRRSATQNSRTACHAEAVGALESTEQSGGSNSSASTKVGSVAKAQVVGMGGGGVLLGLLIGQLIKPTAVEKNLVKGTLGPTRVSVENFVGIHARGAKIAAAQAFGVARFLAAFITIVAAAGEALRPAKTSTGEAGD